MLSAICKNWKTSAAGLLGLVICIAAVSNDPTVVKQECWQMGVVASVVALLAKDADRKAD
jgi:hypothetical protein